MIKTCLAPLWDAAESLMYEPRRSDTATAGGPSRMWRNSLSGVVVRVEAACAVAVFTTGVSMNVQEQILAGISRLFAFDQDVPTWKWYNGEWMTIELRAEKRPITKLPEFDQIINQWWLCAADPAITPIRVKEGS